jgi:alpha-aminoadipate/glutamate carrier protein LysW
MPTALCPECDEEVFVDADSEQGDVVTCDECASRLEVVGLDPVELDLRSEDEPLDPSEAEDYESLDYEDERF